MRAAAVASLEPAAEAAWVEEVAGVAKAGVKRAAAMRAAAVQAAAVQAAVEPEVAVLGLTLTLGLTPPLPSPHPGLILATGVVAMGVVVELEVAAQMVKAAHRAGCRVATRAAAALGVVATETAARPVGWGAVWEVWGAAVCWVGPAAMVAAAMARVAKIVAVRVVAEKAAARVEEMSGVPPRSLPPPPPPPSPLPSIPLPTSETRAVTAWAAAPPPSPTPPLLPG